MALSLPEATEQSHQRHPDFRVSGKIFATLEYPRKGWGMVVLTAQQQVLFVDADPRSFVPATGMWGRRGATLVHLRFVTRHLLAKALESAWSNKANKSLTSRIEGQVP